LLASAGGGENGEVGLETGREILKLRGTMADKKVEKALYGPSTFEVALGAGLGLLAGVALACVYLVFKPVQAVKEAPKEPVKGVVYYRAGNLDSAKSRSWQAKLATFMQGGAVVANEEELNAWASSLHAAPAPAAAKPGEKAAPAAPATPAASEFLSASGLNFRLDGDRLHVAQKVLLNYYGVTKEVVFQASGTFARGGSGYVFAPTEVYFGSCPLHAVPGAVGVLTKALLAKQKVPDDFRTAWAKVAEIGVEGGLLKVTTQP
jgi:hypothetical protein